MEAGAGISVTRIVQIQLYEVLDEGGLVAGAEAQATTDSIFPSMPWFERFVANVQASQPQFTHPEL